MACRLVLVCRAMIDDQLRYFIVVAKHEHLGRAAEQLGLSQPALSRSISRLEEEFDTRLFDRSGRRIQLNANGKMLLRHVERALAELEDVRKALQDSKEDARHSVGIGFLATFGVRLIPDLIRRFKVDHPAVQFRLLQGPYPSLRERLVSGEIDLCLVSPRFIDANLDWKPLYNEELCVLVPRAHRLASKMEINLAEIADDPVVALKKDYGMRRYVDDLCREAGFVPQIAYEGEEVATLIGLVGASFGVTLAPAAAAKDSDLVKALRVREPQCRRTIGLAWRRGRYMSETTARFREHIIATLTKGKGASRRE